jgi:hypothetical protein
MVTVLFSTFHDNSASGANGGSGRDGIDDDDGVGGRSGSPANGGAIFTDGGTLALTNCTFFANSVTGGDGGNGGNGGTAGFGGDGGNGGLGGPGNGGAVYGARGATTTVVNCSFSDNNAIGGTGGLGGAAGSSVTRGGRDGADGAGFGGAVADGGGSFVLKNTILAYSSLSVNGAGTITDGGNNLSSDSSPPFTSPYSKNNLDPFLEPLTLNGGQTPTMALSPDSPAIDAADDSACLPEDQRHRARSGPCDIGAYEFDGLVPVAELTVRRTDGDLVLSWPTLVSGYTLESTPSLAPASWATVTNAPVVLGLEYVLTNMIEATNRFYRLVK